MRRRRETTVDLENAYSRCERCGEPWLFLDLGILGYPQPRSMVTRSICPSCIVAFDEWWKAGQPAVTGRSAFTPEMERLVEEGRYRVDQPGRANPRDAV